MQRVINRLIVFLQVSARVGRISDESDSVVWTAPDESASSSLTSKNIGEKKSGEEPSRRDGRFIDAQQQSAKLIGNEKYGEPVARDDNAYAFHVTLIIVCKGFDIQKNQNCIWLL